MNLKLDKAIANYVSGINQQDSEATIAAFAIEAIVYDEGESFTGLDQIRDWIDASRKKYAFKLEPTAQKELPNGERIMTAIVTGTFKGSPAQINFRFKSERNKITQLFIG